MTALNIFFKRRHDRLVAGQPLGLNLLEGEQHAFVILRHDFDELGDEVLDVWNLIKRHQTYTHSVRAAAVLADWKNLVPKFVKVMPQDYKRVLLSLKKVQSQGLTGDEAVMAAFEENVKGGH